MKTKTCLLAFMMLLADILTCSARSASSQEFLDALFKGKQYPVALNISTEYPWKADHNKITTTSRQDDMSSNCWFSLGIYVPADSASVSFDYNVRYHKETYGWAKYANLTCLIDGVEAFSDNGTDKKTSATIRVGKGFHTLKWNLYLGEAWENWDYFASIENMVITGISDDSPIPEFSKIASRIHTAPLKPCADTILIHNHGKKAFRIESATGLSAPYYLTSSPSEIAPGSEKNIVVEYDPKEDGCHEQTLTLMSGLGKIAIPIRGMSYEMKPVCNPSPGKLAENIPDYNIEQLAIFGPMSRNDNYTLSRLKKLKLLDLRGTDMEIIHNGGINNLYLLEHILLPSSLKTIDATWIFKHWDSNSKRDLTYNIKSITCLSPQPPALVYLGGGNEDHNLDGLNPDVIIHVPAQYLSFYKADPKWGKFSVLPIADDSRSLVVKMDNCRKEMFSGCSFTLTDISTGLTQRLTMGSSDDYVFHNLKPERLYSLKLIHPTRRLIAAEDSIDVSSARETVIRFQKFEPLYEAAVRVSDIHGKELTDKVNTSWRLPGKETDMGKSISGLFAGDSVSCIVSLPDGLSLEYMAPDTLTHVMRDADKIFDITLSPLRRYTLSGTVINADKRPVTSARISVSQLLNNSVTYDKTVTTGPEGRFELQLYEGEATVDISADRCFSIRHTDIFNADSDMGAITMAPCSGSKIKLDVTFEDNRLPGKETYVSPGYDEWKELTFTVRDRENGRKLTDVKVEYPYIYLMDDIGPSTLLSVDVATRKGIFKSFTADCEKTESGDFIAKIPIVEYGDVRISYLGASTTPLISMVFSSDGTIYGKYPILNSRAEIKKIPDGSYDVILIESSNMYGNISRLGDMAAMGLEENESFSSSHIETRSGEILEIAFSEVPSLADQSRIVDNKSHIVPNRSSVVAGNYVTVKSSVIIKPEYQGNVKDLTLNILIPDHCRLIENSFLIGNRLADYSIEGNTVRIPVSDDSEPVRFCMLPMAGGTMNLSAFVSYELDGRHYDESIGGFTADVTGISINVLPSVPSADMNVSGSGIPGSRVEILDDETVIGRANILANGSWHTRAQLCDPSDLKTHTLYAKITTPDGEVLYTESKRVRINTAAPYVRAIEMANGSNGPLKLFDIDNSLNIDRSYSYSSSKPLFSFKVTLGNVPDSLQLNDAVLWVKTTDGKDVPLKLVPSTDDNSTLIASHTFPGSGSLPTNVAVSLNNIDETLMTADNIYALLEESLPMFRISGVLKDGDAMSYRVTSTHEDLVLLCAAADYVAGDATSGKIEKIMARFGFSGLQSDGQFLCSDAGGTLRIKKIEDGKLRAFFLYDMTNEDEYNTLISMLGRNLVNRTSRAQVDPSTNRLVPDRSFSLFGRVDNAQLALIDLCNRKLDCVEKMGEVSIEYAAEDLRSTINNLRQLDVAMTLAIVSGTYEITGDMPSGQNIVSDAMSLSDLPGDIASVADAMEGITESTRLHVRNLMRYPTECGLSSAPDYVAAGITPLIDPSGYVYEAVESNRLEGVTATAYFKTVDKDAEGNDVEKVSLWDARMYGQENPLITDSYGRYSWDVPAGLWQVKYERPGYETAYSEWLPVPPPQLEVNIGMTQLVNPTLSAAVACEDSIVISFSKYMDARLLTSENIIVKKDGEAVEGKVIPADAGKTAGREYASKAWFMPDMPFRYGDTVSLFVSKRARSYAGCPLPEDYNETLTVGNPVMINMDKTVKVPMGTREPLTIKVSPVEAVIGQTLSLKVDGESVASVREKDFVIGQDSRIIVEVEGIMIGTTSVTAEIAGLRVRSSAEIEVTGELMGQTYAPWSTAESGTVISKGTKIYLFSATPDATIYYTTDGSCPCDHAERILYNPDEGITVNRDMTIRSLAVAEGMYESDITEFSYTITPESGIGDIKARTQGITVTPTLLKSGNCDISIHYPDVAEYATVEILNTDGRLISRHKVPDSASVSLYSLPAGMYVVCVDVNGTKRAVKVVKSF